MTVSYTWWRHQMETFSALLAICAGNSPVPGEFPTQRPVTRSFDVFFDVRPNKQLSKQSWGWWFETLSPSLWRHRNEFNCKCYTKLKWCSWLGTPCQHDDVMIDIIHISNLVANSILIYMLNVIGDKKPWSLSNKSLPISWDIALTVGNDQMIDMVFLDYSICRYIWNQPSQA